MRNVNNFDVIVVGAGFAGATIARLLADEGKKVLVIDKRNHIGGNMYDYRNKNNLLIQKYGPHIFHTGDINVWRFVNRFSDFFSYKHRVLGNIDGILVPIPFNFKSLELTHTKEEADLIKQEIRKEFSNQLKVSILDLLHSKNKTIKKFAKYVYEKVFVYYTTKQWGVHPNKINEKVLKQVPVMLGYADTYFYDKYQYMPSDGFTTLFKKLLKSKNISVLLNTNITSIVNFKRNDIYIYGQKYLGKFIYTGAIDELFNYKYGVLPYRTLKFVLEEHNCKYYQPAATVNYPTSKKFTRISEYKYFDLKNNKSKKTIIAKEYSSSYSLASGSDPYYPINNEFNDNLYFKYKNLADKYNIVLCGRLAEYKYYRMETTIQSAFIVASKILRQKD